VVQFALKSYGPAQQSGEQEPADDYGVQVVEHRIPPCNGAILQRAILHCP
jgi:hypothetical protein